MALSADIAKELKCVRESILKASQESSKKNINVNLRADEIEDATCEQSIILDKRMADIENALCELSEKIGG